MNPRYCYWSVCDGPYAGLMEECVASARAAGVFHEFHVLTDRVIEECECYDAHKVEKANGIFKIVYLQTAISKLLFDYFIWIDADSRFTRNPRNVLACLDKSPIHVPLISRIPPGSGQSPLPVGLTCEQYESLMVKGGVTNPIYTASTAFWIIHHDAIDHVFSLASDFLVLGRDRGLATDASAGLSYAMQMLCGDPEAHRVAQWPGLWASDDENHFQDGPPHNTPWPVQDLFGEKTMVSPAIVHMPHRKHRIVQPVNGPAATPSA